MVGVIDESHAGIVFHAVDLEADAVAPTGRDGAEIDILFAEKGDQVVVFSQGLIHLKHELVLNGIDVLRIVEIDVQWTAGKETACQPGKDEETTGLFHLSAGYSKMITFLVIRPSLLENSKK